jgi:hypothetical protein
MKRWSRPDKSRIQNQLSNYQYPSVGYTVTWRQWVSAVSGNDVAGFGPTDYYREQVITAFMGQFIPPNIRQHQTLAGAIPAGAFFAITREAIGKDDLLMWQGSAYRVEGEPIHLALTQQYIVEVKRATP